MVGLVVGSLYTGLSVSLPSVWSYESSYVFNQKTTYSDSRSNRRLLTHYGVEANYSGHEYDVHLGNYPLLVDPSEIYVTFTPLRFELTKTFTKLFVAEEDSYTRPIPYTNMSMADGFVVIYFFRQCPRAKDPQQAGRKKQPKTRYNENS